MRALAMVFVFTLHASLEQQQPEVCTAPYENLSTGCYFFHREVMNWFQASEYCRDIGGRIVMIDNEEENTAITKFLEEQRVQVMFLGGSSTGHKGQWYWEATMKPVTFFKWAWGHPIVNDARDCMCLAYAILVYRWMTCPCLNDFPFVCESCSKVDPKTLLNKRFF